MSPTRALLAFATGIGVVALVALGAFAGYAALSRPQQVRACERGNKLRKEVDRRGDTIVVLTDVVRTFLRDAQHQRAHEWTVEHDPAKRAVALKYRRGRVRLNSTGELVPFGRVDCERAIPLLPL